MNTFDSIIKEFESITNQHIFTCDEMVKLYRFYAYTNCLTFWSCYSILYKWIKSVKESFPYSFNVLKSI